MGAYRVVRAYAAERDGEMVGPWAAGDTVDLDEATAAWVERDSPGCLAVPGKPQTEPEPAVEPEREQPKPVNRQARAGRNRGL